MSNNFNIGNPPTVTSQDRPKFNYRDPLIDLGIAVQGSMANHSQKLAEHEGKISGLSVVVSSLQSYKGFLQAVLFGLLAFVLAGFGLIATLQSKSEQKVEKISSRMGTIEDKVDNLPGRISKEIRETSRDLVLISRNSENSATQSQK